MATTNVMKESGAYEFNSINPASPEIRRGFFGGRNIQQNVAAFPTDSLVAPSLEFQFRMPAAYAGGGLTTLIHHGNGEVLTGNVYWGLSFQVVVASSTDMSAAAVFGTETVSAVTVHTSRRGFKATALVVTHANAGSPAAGDLVRCRLRRISTNVLDTHNGEAFLYNISINET